MIDVTQDIQPLTTFRNNSVKMLEQLKRTGRPIVVTVNGKAEATVLSAVEYQRLMDMAAEASEREGVRQGDEDIVAGRTRPAEAVFAERRRTPSRGDISLAKKNDPDFDQKTVYVRKVTMRDAMRRYEDEGGIEQSELVERLLREYAEGGFRTIEIANVDHYTYRVTWSAEDGEYVARCAEMPSMSWLAATPEDALVGIRKVVAEAVADLQTSGKTIL